MSMKRLAGFDNHGNLYDDGSRMRRSVNQDYRPAAHDVYEALRGDLSRLGIVETDYIPEKAIHPSEAHHQLSARMDRWHVQGGRPLSS